MITWPPERPSLLYSSANQRESCSETKLVFRPCPESVRVPPTICLTWPWCRSMQGRNAVMLAGSRGRLRVRFEYYFQLAKLQIPAFGTALPSREPGAHPGGNSQSGARVLGAGVLWTIAKTMAAGAGYAS